MEKNDSKPKKKKWWLLASMSFLVPFLMVGGFWGAFIWVTTLQDYPHFSVFAHEVVELALFSFCSSGLVAGAIGAIVFHCVIIRKSKQPS